MKKYFFTILKNFFSRFGFLIIYPVFNFISIFSLNNNKKIVFILGEDGWILEKIARVIAESFEGYEILFSIQEPNLPNADIYFFMHYRLLISAMRRNIFLHNRNVFVWFTHPGADFSHIEDELCWLLNHRVYTFAACSKFKYHLECAGVSKGRIEVILGGIDATFEKYRDQILSHRKIIQIENSSPVVGLCSAFYERKQPSIVFDIVRLMPDVKFVLVGKNWSHWTRFDELTALKNFEYRELDFQMYGDFYRSLDAFLSVSSIEGGPIPLIEAMYFDVPPVTSDTGFARDLIKSDSHGFIFDVDTDVPEIVNLLYRAIDFNPRGVIHSSVSKLTWTSFGKAVSRRVTQRCSRSRDVIGSG